MEDTNQLLYLRTILLCKLLACLNRLHTTVFKKRLI